MMHKGEELVYLPAAGSRTVTVAVRPLRGWRLDQVWCMGHLATRSTTCRPTKRLIFNLYNHAAISRVAVLPDGKIVWVAGGMSHRWMSLSDSALQVAPEMPTPAPTPENSAPSRWSQLAQTSRLSASIMVGRHMAMPTARQPCRL